MKIGFLKSLLFYLIGLGLAAISHFTIGHPYIHAPALHHLIIFLTFTIGFLWLIFASIRYFAGNRTESLRGVIFVNLFMSLGFALLMAAYIINDAKDNSQLEQFESKVTIEESGDTTTMYHGGSPVYLKVKDSVLINFIDSAKINWSEVEIKKK